MGEQQTKMGSMNKQATQTVTTATNIWGEPYTFKMPTEGQVKHLAENCHIVWHLQGMWVWAENYPSPFSGWTRHFVLMDDKVCTEIQFSRAEAEGVCLTILGIA
jgi:hypothetical protein